MMDLIGLPLTSIVLFVLAGILIGHSFWYQDRSGDRAKMDWLEKRYVQARNVARRRKLDQRELKKTRDQQQYELGSLRQRYEASQIQFKALERSSQSASSELESLRCQRREMEQQLESEQRRSERLVSQLQEVLQAKSTLESQLEHQTERIASLSGPLAKPTPELETKVEVLQGELNQSKEALKRVDEDLYARSNDLDAMRTQRDTLKQELSKSHRHATQVEKEATRQTIKLTNVREQLEELLPLRAESAESCLTIAQQRLELDAKQEEVERLREQASRTPRETEEKKPSAQRQAA